MQTTARNPYQPLSTPRPRWSEYWIPSAAGAPGPALSPGGTRSPNGRWHAGLDWFGPAGTPVRAPVAGVVIESRGGPSGSKRVYGGTVKVQHESGMVWVARHINPAVPEGRRVAAGDLIAHVAPWAGGSPHAHIEVWRTLGGGYTTANMLDPWTFTYSTRTGNRAWPPPHGDTLRIVLATAAEQRDGKTRRFAGWVECAGPMAWAAEHGLADDTAAVIAWRGNVWRGPREVAGVCRSLVARFL